MSNFFISTNVPSILNVLLNKIKMKKIIFNYLMSKQWFLQLLRQHFDKEMECVEYNAFSEGCGLEYLKIQNRYEPMEYGWYNGVKVV